MTSPTYHQRSSINLPSVQPRASVSISDPRPESNQLNWALRLGAPLKQQPTTKRKVFLSLGTTSPNSEHCSLATFPPGVITLSARQRGSASLSAFRFSRSLHFSRRSSAADYDRRRLIQFPIEQSIDSHAEAKQATKK